MVGDGSQPATSPMQLKVFLEPGTQDALGCHVLGLCTIKTSTDTLSYQLSPVGVRDGPTRMWMDRRSTLHRISFGCFRTDLGRQKDLARMIGENKPTWGLCEG